MFRCPQQAAGFVEAMLPRSGEPRTISSKKTYRVDGIVDKHGNDGMTESHVEEAIRLLVDPVAITTGLSEYDIVGYSGAIAGCAPLTICEQKVVVFIKKANSLDTRQSGLNKPNCGQYWLVSNIAYGRLQPYGARRAAESECTQATCPGWLQRHLYQC